MALLDHLKALAKTLAGLLTDDAVQVTGTNATDVTDTTAQALIALEAGKELVITQLHIVNKTAAELQAAGDKLAAAEADAQFMAAAAAHADIAQRVLAETAKLHLSAWETKVAVRQRATG